MKKVYSFIRKAARFNMPVLIVGETGTGKELVAREIHSRSQRRDGPFIPVNMGALPLELVASELFGHVKGAFTGAVERKDGRFREARGGMLFLDEITTLDESAQVGLLRVLETRKYRRVGGSRDLTTDVRVLTATNVNPRRAIRQKTFREDLLHRLQVLRVALPPLRQRKSDIKRLAEHFLAVFCREFESEVGGISRDALDLLRAYNWPGNVRELKNVIAQAAVVAEQGEIAPRHLPDRVGAARTPVSSAEAYDQALEPSPGGSAEPYPLIEEDVRAPSLAGSSDGIYVPLGSTLEQAERAVVLRTLHSCGYNKARAARILGLSRKALYDKLARWGVPKQSPWAG